MRREARESPVVVAELAGSAQYGGGERYLELLIERLDRTRFQPILICPEPGPFVELMRKRGVPTRVVHLAPLVNPAALVRLAALLRRERVEILQAHGLRSNVYGCLAAWLARVPAVIWTVHNSPLAYEVGALRRWIYGTILRGSTPLADRIICVSEALRQDLLTHVRAAPDRTVTIYNGIDPARLRPSREGAAVRDEFKLGHGPLLVVIGRLTEQKGHRYLLEALPALLTQWPTLRCLLVGDGELRSALARVAADRGVASACVFAGAREDIPDLLGAADVVVLPSVSEGFPFVLLEALGMGKPVVATKVAGVTELIEDEKTGRLVPAKDPAALAEVLGEVLRDPDRAAEMGRAGRRVVQERFTADRMASQIVQQFGTALRARTGDLPAGRPATIGATSPQIEIELVACPCGSPAAPQELFRTPSRRYARCPACGLVFLNPRPPAAAVTQFYREAYDGAYGQAESGSDRLPVFQGVLRHLSGYRRPPGRLLDVGCGDGEFLVLCRAAGWTCSGVELSKEAGARAARRGLTMLPIEWMEAAPRAGPEPGPYDVMTLVNVLETVLDPAAVLRRVRSALVPHGLVVIRVSNAAFHLPLRRPAAWLGARYQQAFHLFVYTPHALRRLLEMTGFRIVSVRNSHPSRGQVSVSTHAIARLAWRVGGAGLWGVAGAAYWLSGGHALWAPSIEVVAERNGGRP